MKESSSVHQLTKSINVLDAIYWIGLAFKNIKWDPVENCFRKAGFVQSEDWESRTWEQPFSRKENVCHPAAIRPEEYVCFDDNVETHVTFNSDISLSLLMIPQMKMKMSQNIQSKILEK